MNQNWYSIVKEKGSSYCGRRTKWHVNSTGDRSPLTPLSVFMNGLWVDDEDQIKLKSVCESVTTIWEMFYLGVEGRRRRENQDKQVRND